MREMDALEQAYKNGYAAGMKAAEEKIVHCKDCCFNYGLMHDSEETPYYPDDIVCSVWMTDGLSENDFCSYGERRSDG